MCVWRAAGTVAGSPEGGAPPRVGAASWHSSTGEYSGVLDTSLRSAKTQEELGRLLIDRTGAFIGKARRQARKGVQVDTGRMEALRMPLGEHGQECVARGHATVGGGQNGGWGQYDWGKQGDRAANPKLGACQRTPQGGGGVQGAVECRVPMALRIILWVPDSDRIQA